MSAQKGLVKIFKYILVQPELLENIPLKKKSNIPRLSKKCILCTDDCIYILKKHLKDNTLLPVFDNF